MPDEEFEENRESVIEDKLQKDHTLREESDRFWEQIWDPRWARLSCFTLFGAFGPALNLNIRLWVET